MNDKHFIFRKVKINSYDLSTVHDTRPEEFTYYIIVEMTEG